MCLLEFQCTKRLKPHSRTIPVLGIFFSGFFFQIQSFSLKKKIWNCHQSFIHFIPAIIMCSVDPYFFRMTMCALASHDSSRNLHIIRKIWSKFHAVSSLWPCHGDIDTTLAQVMACCLRAPSHYLYQCSLHITEVLWYSPEKTSSSHCPSYYSTIILYTVKFLI